jgi:hypothetical protein
MRPDTGELEAAKWMAERLRCHKWRVENWQKIEHNFTPEGLTCPKCGADHCEVDKHSC